MRTFYFTFGQNHTHPVTEELMRDYWIEISACNYDEATELMNRLFNCKWSHQYDKQSFQKHYFPKGCYEKFSIIKNTRVGNNA